MRRSWEDERAWNPVLHARSACAELPKVGLSQCHSHQGCSYFTCAVGLTQKIFQILSIVEGIEVFGVTFHYEFDGFFGDREIA